MDSIVTPFGVRFEFRRNLFLPSGWPYEDSVLLQTLFVVGEVLHRDGVFPNKPVTARRTPRFNAGHGQLQRFPVECRHDPPYGTNKSRALKPGPGHGFWPCQVMHRAWKNLRQDLRGGAPDLDLLRCQVFPLGCLHEVKVIDVDALLLGKTLRCTCRRADGIVRN